jgi:hypothetical protein
MLFDRVIEATTGQYINNRRITMRVLVLAIAALAVSAASASADGYGHRHRHHYQYGSYYRAGYYDYGYFRVYAGLYGGGYRPWGRRGWW